MKRGIVVAVLTSLSIIAVVSAQPGQYPVMEGIAKKVIGKYQTASCEQLWAEKAKPPTAQQAESQDKAVTLLRQDPAMRKAFIDMVAGPIVNKMFECGMVP